MIWSEYLPFLFLFNLTFRALCLGQRLEGVPLLVFSFKHGCIPVGSGTVQWYTWRGGHASNPSGYIYKVFVTEHAVPELVCFL